MNEVQWTQMVSEILDKKFKNYSIEGGKKLIYANEITGYKNDHPIYNDMKYETDILVYEIDSNEHWIPRVVIEGKIKSMMQSC